MPRVAGLRSPHARVGRIVHFGRCLDKIRLHARGALPEDYHEGLGQQRTTALDGRCCRFLGVAYEELRTRTLAGGCDEEVLAWAHGLGVKRTDEECVGWNRFMSKIGWRDDRTEALKARIGPYGLPPGTPVETSFELIDADEGRPLGATRSWENPAPPVIVVMGVSGCGKSTVGAALAASLGWKFIDTDSLHPPANIAKMSAGVPLTDDDRAPWLAAVRAAIDSLGLAGAGGVVACSALKEAHRMAIAPDPDGVRFAHVRGDYGLVRSRMEARQGHYMKADLLRSQFEALEDPVYGLGLDARSEPAEMVARVRSVLSL